MNTKFTVVYSRREDLRHGLPIEQAERSHSVLARIALSRSQGFTNRLMFSSGARYQGLVPSLEMCIIREMYRAEVEPMPSNPPDRVARSGLWRVTIYERERFVRTDKENMVISVAEKLAKELNYQFGYKRKGRGAQ